MGNVISRNTIYGCVNLADLPAPLKERIGNVMQTLLEEGARYNDEPLENITINFWISPERDKYFAGLDASSSCYPFVFFEENELGAPKFLTLPEAATYRQDNNLDVSSYRLLVEQFNSWKSKRCRFGR